jgi:hypothetical protein
MCDDDSQISQRRFLNCEGYNVNWKGKMKMNDW